MTASPTVIINHAGRLLDSNDGPVNAPVKLKVAFYKALTGGDPIFTDTFAQVSVTKGIYALSLGDNTVDTSRQTIAASLFDGSPLYVQVTVNDEDLSPRLIFGTVPNAAHALLSDSAKSADGLSAAATLPGTQVTGSVSHADAAAALDAAAKIAGGTQVTGSVPHADAAAALDATAKIAGGTQVSGSVPHADSAAALDGKLAGTQVTGSVAHADAATTLDGSANGALPANLTIAGSQVTGAVPNALSLGGVPASKFLQTGSGGSVGDLTAASVHFPGVTASLNGTYPSGPRVDQLRFLRTSNSSVFKVSSLAWESGDVYNPFVLRDGDHYNMYYAGAGTAQQIGLATAPVNPSGGGDWFAAANWTRNPNNPIVRADSCDRIDPVVIKVSDSGDSAPYKMWFTMCSKGVGFATSADGIAWTQNQNNPVLRNDTSVDSSGIRWLSVIRDVNASGQNYYRMYYGAYDGTNWRICYATSSDGIIWTKPQVDPDTNDGYRNVVMGRYQNSTGTIFHTYGPTVIKVGSLYYMLLIHDPASSGGSRHIYLAMSRDGLVWTHATPGGLVLSENYDRWWDGAADQGERPDFFLDGTKAYLFYAAPRQGWQIGVQTADF